MQSSKPAIVTCSLNMHVLCDRASVHYVNCTVPFEQTGTPEPVPPGGRLPHLSG